MAPGGGRGKALVFLPGLHLGGPLWFHHERAVSTAPLDKYGLTCGIELLK